MPDTSVPTPEQLPFTLPARPQAPILSTTEQRRKDLETQGPRIGRIHNPFLKGLATVGDILLGTFAPRAEMLTPGTEGNYMMRLARATHAEQADQAAAEGEARTRLQEQQAEEARQHALLFGAQAAHAGDTTKPDQFTPVKAGEGLWDRNLNGGKGGWAIEPTDPEMVNEITPEQGQKLGIVPTKDGKYLLPKGGAMLLKPDPDKPAGTVHQADDGTFIVVHPDGSATRVMVDGEPVKGKAPEAGNKITTLEINGKPHEVMVDSAGNVVKDMGEKGREPSTADYGMTGIDPNTNQVIRLRPGQTAPPGFVSLSGESSVNVKQGEAKQGAQDAMNYANEYLKGNSFTGAGDEALGEKFFELAKPSSGFRMTQPQIDILYQARDLLQGFTARAKHALTPNAPYFDDTQRRNIVKTMNDLAKAKGLATEGTQPTGAGGPKTIKSKAEFDALPKGSQYIDADGKTYTKK